MCEKCIELDKRIAHYRELAALTPDVQAIDAIASLVEECETEKRALHADDD